MSHRIWDTEQQVWVYPEDQREALAELLEATAESSEWAATPDADLYGALADAALAWFSREGK